MTYSLSRNLNKSLNYKDFLLMGGGGIALALFHDINALKFLTIITNGMVPSVFFYN